MQKKYKELYLYMKENNELRRVFYDMTGDWEVDKDKFIQAQTELEQTAGIIDVYEEE